MITENTAAEKQRKAEKRGRRKAEVVERKAQRKAQLAALKPYWFLLRYNINARACPQEFFLFWARHLLVAAPMVILGVFKFLDFIRHLFFMAFIVIILTMLFPPVLMFVEMSIVAFLIGVILMITTVLLCIAGYLPILTAAFRRRINDVSPTVSAANVRFLVLLATGGTLVGTMVVCALSWIGISVFATGGALSWIVTVGYVLMAISLVLLVGQLHHYSFAPGVKGENFAGPNPAETPLTVESIQAMADKPASRLWQILALVLMCLAIAISFSLSRGFIRGLSALSTIDVALKAMSPEKLGFLTYSLQVLAAAAAIFFVCVKPRIAKRLSETEVDHLNAFFRPRVADEIPEELRNRVAQAEKSEARERPGAFMGIICLAFKTWWFLTKLGFIPLYYAMLGFTLYCGCLYNRVFPIAAFILLPATIVGYYYVKARLESGSAPVEWKGVRDKADKRLRDGALEILRLPITWFKGKPAGSESILIRKRRNLRDVALFDPLGIHNFVLGQYELGAIQVCFCLMFVGIPISWLWSLLDSFRFARLSDDEFLRAYPDYCVSTGFADSVMKFLGQIAKWLLFFVIAVVLMCFAIPPGWVK